MRFIQQGNLRDCGPIAVAALTDTTLETVKSLIKKRGGTTTKHLVSALHRLGYECPDACVALRSAVFHERLFFGLAQLRSPDQSGWHWVAIGNGMVYDGSSAGPMEYREYVNLQAMARARITSVLPVWRNLSGSAYH